MAASRFPMSQLTSEQIVENAGTILFRLSTQKVCLLHLLPRDEYVLAKRRRNIRESRQKAAHREVKEETGYCCRLLPITMNSRIPPAIETKPFGDVLRRYTDVTKSFTIQIRHLETAGDVKLIWWFIAAVDEDFAPDTERLREERLDVEFFGYEAAMEKPTFHFDRKMVKRAVAAVQAVYY